jgi:cell division protease FtsH
MAESNTNGAAPPSADRGEDTEPARRPSDHHGDDHRHPSGWRIDPGPGGRGTPPAKPPTLRTFSWRFLLVLAFLLALNWWLVSMLPQPAPERVRIPYSPVFLNQVRAGNVKSIASKGATVQGELRHALRYPPNSRSAKPTSSFKTEVPAFANQDRLSALLEEKGVVVNAEAPQSERSPLATLLLAFGPTLLLVALFVFLIRRAAGGVGGGVTAFGRSRARRIEPSQQRINFNDVAGIDEAKAELIQIVDFLRDPDKYRRLGGRIPRGVLLTGPPGTGKTLLARALAGEAGVPFFSISASEFVELFVGVGASRVRDLFAEAKKAAPAIIFIDELDAIGRARGPGIGVGGGHDEREQTLNQILTEMDGFDPSIGVIVLSATNRPEVIDPALLRPGRFDRRVTLQPPDTDGRRKILAVHTRSVPLADDVDLDELAGSMPGMVGADLANVVNEAALLAASRGRDAVARIDFDDALEKLILGTERRILLSPEERRRTAYHEAGHAIVAMLTLGADPIRKVSIIPRGIALGVTLSAPEADRFSYDRGYLLGKIKVALGGRVAEELVFDDITTGAQSDIKDVTDLARNMVGLWGMSERVGPLAVIPENGQVALPGASTFSPDTAKLVDEEVRRLVDDALDGVRDLLTGNRDKLDALAEALLEHETLDTDDAYAAAGISRRAPKTASPDASSNDRREHPCPQAAQSSERPQATAW